MTTATTENPTANPAGGPRTAEGKEKSRRNSVKLGLRSKVVFPEDLEKIIAEILRDFRDEFRPGSRYEDAMIREMAIATAKVERCSSFIAADITAAARRAVEHWETDRMASVDRFAMKLPEAPLRIARGLLRSKQGVQWLVEHWIELKANLLENGCWDEDQRILAFDLLGIPHVLRKHTGDVPRCDDRDRILKLIDRKLEELLTRQDELESLDESERELAILGMPFEEDARTARIRREENRARRDFNKARDALFHYRATGQMPTTKTKTKTKPGTDRAPLSKAAEDNLVKRSEMPRVIVRVEAEPEPVAVTAPVAAPTPVAAPSHAPAAVRAPSPVPGVSEKRPNRLARKQQARRDREAAKAAAKR